MNTVKLSLSRQPSVVKQTHQLIVKLMLNLVVSETDLVFLVLLEILLYLYSIFTIWSWSLKTKVEPVGLTTNCRTRGTCCRCAYMWPSSSLGKWIPAVPRWKGGREDPQKQHHLQGQTTLQALLLEDLLNPLAATWQSSSVHSVSPC